MALSTSTSTLAAGASRTFNLSPGSALTLVAPPNVRATVTETPNTVSASDVGGNASRTHNLQMVQTVTYGPYPMGGTVVVANAINSGATITWVRSDSIVAESAAGALSLVDGAGNIISLQKERPILYIDGDSLMSRTNREESLTAFSIASNVITFTTPASIGAHGATVRLYGFADSRLNCEGTLIADSTSTRMILPTSVPDGNQSNYPALAGGSQRAYTVDCLMAECSVITWASLLAGKRWSIKLLARGGRRSADILADFDALLAGRTPGVLLMESGVNTGKNSETVAQVSANYESMIQTALRYGHRVILTTPTTFSSAQGGSYATLNRQLFQQGAEMRRLAQKYNVGLLDLAKLFVDGASSDGQPPAAYIDSGDGIHWTGTAAKALAPSLNTMLAEYQVRFDEAPLLRSIADCAYTQAGGVLDAANTNKLRNGQMFGTSGTGSTNVPDGWNLALTGITATNSKVASPLSGSDGTFRISAAGSSGNNFLLSSTSFHADISAGKTVRASGRFRFNTTLVTRCHIGLLLTINGRANQQIAALNTIGAPLASAIGDYTFDWMTPDWVCPVGATVTAASVFVQAVLTGTVTADVFELSQCRADVI